MSGAAAVAARACGSRTAAVLCLLAALSRLSCLTEVHEPALYIHAASDPGPGGAAREGEHRQQERPPALGRPLPQQTIGGGRAL
ncbi:hypothetical protein OG302_42735 [Streptomyces sp. NBC_01283]|uniref:hypothetical protein n=1 Tax=Streptomyces sp. NBC_01283 TaxID=2903812 RepID=UPI00352C5859|nr:hypothetical protein OG302_42735 [Streptomyces sp. NBC_01283]